MWQASAFFGAAVVLNLIIGPTSEQVPPPLWIIFGVGILAGVLHPTSPLLRIPRPVDQRLLGLTAVIEVALVSGVASARLCKRLGVGDRPRQIGIRVGIAGALGFLTGSLVAAALGFVVGEPPGVNMVWALHIANAGAGLAAGWHLGRQLVNSRVASKQYA